MASLISNKKGVQMLSSDVISKPVETIFSWEKSVESIPVKVNIPGKEEVTFSIQRPDRERIKVTAEVAKRIFVQAFEKSYTRYYDEAQPGVSIEEWLRIKSDLRGWLGSIFDEEYQECQNGTKGFIHLCDSRNNLVGWLSHSQVDEKGDLYLSQCSLEADWSNKKVSTTAFAEVLNGNHLVTMFPRVKEVKLIVRKINKVAQQLYTRAGFTCDETIRPEDYGSSYDDRYIGFRRRVNLL